MIAKSQTLHATNKAGIIHAGGVHLNNHHRPRMAHLLALLSLCILSSCNPINTPPASTPSPIPSPSHTVRVEPSQTPFVPQLETATPGILHLWLSPHLPSELSDPILQATSIAGRPIRVVTDQDSADVRVEPWAEVSLNRWIYALVAPFPTLVDGMTFEDLEAVWRGESPEFQTIYLHEEDVLSIEALFDGKPPANAIVVESAELLEQAWLDPKAIAILPFQSLHPRWKVLEVDGISPIRKDFQEESYSLKVDYGLSGKPKDISFLTDSLGWKVSNRDSDHLTILVMTGVTALTRATAWTMEQKGIEYPAEKIGPWLLEADITHISNEVPFLDRCPSPKPVREGLEFCSDPDYVALLDVIGVDIIELTGNHLKDFGTEGLDQTLEIYRQKNWQYFGGGEDLEDALQPVLIEHNGNRLAFLGCNLVGPPSVWAKESSPGSAPCSEGVLFAELGRLRSEGYLPIFTYQWFEFYQLTPTTKQIADFHAPIDAGAVIVSGSQAHRPQGFEFYGEGFIHYGLGNLFFDQMWSLVTRQEFIDRHVFYEGRHISTELLTAFLEDFAQPRPMTTEERRYFLQEIFEASGW